MMLKVSNLLVSHKRIYYTINEDMGCILSYCIVTFDTAGVSTILSKGRGRANKVNVLHLYTVLTIGPFEK